MRFNLEETWKNCLTMWGWIARRKRAEDERCVEDLKAEWLKKHGFRPEGKDLNADCFFCEYIVYHTGDCTLCPGCQVDENFFCTNDDYDYGYEPIKFYEKLVELNKKRLRKAKHGK